MEVRIIKSCDLSEYKRIRLEGLKVNPEAFGRNYDARTLKAGAVLSLGSILPETDYGDFTEAPPLEYSVSEDIDYENLDEDDDLFDPIIGLF